VGVELSGRQGQVTPESAGAVPADPDEVLLLVEDEAPPVGEPQPALFTSLRHRTADRAAQWLADPPPGRGSQAMAAEIDVTVQMIPELAQVFSDVPQTVAAWPAGAVRVVRGSGGVVVRVHGDAWSAVFRIGGRVLVVLDSMPDIALRVDRDRDWVPEVTGMVEAVLRELDRHAPGGDRYPGGH
jgi:hypothetical protein